MASSFIVTRETRSGARRFVVRYRLGDRAWPVQHGGSFSTMREARACRDLIAGELAAVATRQRHARWPTWQGTRARRNRLTPPATLCR